VSVQPPAQRQVENLATVVRRLERDKRVLEDWMTTLERTVVAHERVRRDRETDRALERTAWEAERAAHAAEVRVRTQELTAVERRLSRTLESQSFRLGHLLVRTAVSPVKGARWLHRNVRTVLISGYRLGQRHLPRRLVEPVQQVATRGQAATARRHETLDLPGDRPVSFLDCRGLDDSTRDATWARIAKSDQPDRTVVLVDSPDFTGLRAYGLSFEYLPPYSPDQPWWSNQEDHTRWVSDRMLAVRRSYGVDEKGL